MITIEITDNTGKIVKEYRGENTILFNDITENHPEKCVKEITNLVALVEWNNSGTPTIVKYLGVIYK